MIQSIKQNNQSLKMNCCEKLARHSFVFFLILFLLVLCLSLLIGYYYIWRIQSFDQAMEIEKLLKIDALKQQRVLDEWQKRNDNFYKADEKEYNNPFQIRKK